MQKNVPSILSIDLSKDIDGASQIIKLEMFCGVLLTLNWCQMVGISKSALQNISIFMICDTTPTTRLLKSMDKILGTFFCINTSFPFEKNSGKH